MNSLKQEIRIIAWDDCALTGKEIKLVGPIFRGGSYLDGLLSTKVTKDGLDATQQIANCIKTSRNYDQLSVIMLDGISYAGFNLVDIQELYEKTNLPVVVVQRKKPDIENFKATMKKLFDDYLQREGIVENAGPVSSYRSICYQSSGLDTGDAEKLFKITCIRSNIPEPIRVAHIIASGLSGESSGRA